MNRNLKRIMSIVLTFVMLFSLAVPSFAGETEKFTKETAGEVTFTVTNPTLEYSESAQDAAVKIYADKNIGIASFQFNYATTDEKLTLGKATVASAMTSATISNTGVAFSMETNVYPDYDSEYGAYLLATIPVTVAGDATGEHTVSITNLLVADEVGEAYTRTEAAAKITVKEKPVTAPSWYGDGTATSYSIGTAAELRELAQIVNGTHATGIQDNFAGKTVTLTADIALAKDGLYTKVDNVTYGGSGYTMTLAQYYVTCSDEDLWTPIGKGTASAEYNDVTYDAKSVFAGTFDGNGKTVSGIYTGDGTASKGNKACVQGLFGVVTGTVKNLTVSGCVTGSSVVAGIAAYVDGGTITNCTNNAVVFADGGTTPNGKKEDGKYKSGAVGGIAGRVAGESSVTGCKNTAVVSCANTNFGGRLGGIIGLIEKQTDKVTITENINTGAITGYQYQGGIVGYNRSRVSPVDRCTNSGKITGHGIQKVHVGGIVGTYASPITNCYNTGEVYLAYNAYSEFSGGIGGDYDYDGGVDPGIYNCVNYGIVKKNGSGPRSFGMISGEGKTSNNYFLDTARAASNVGIEGGTSKTAEELKSAEFLNILNNGNLNAFVPDRTENPINDGYPVLRWQINASDLTEDKMAFEGEFKTSYIETQKFSAGTFKLYKVYTDPAMNNTEVKLESTAYEVYVGDEKIDIESYTFKSEDNGKTIKVAWTPIGGETSFVEKTIEVGVDYPTSAGSAVNTPKLGNYFVGDTIDLSKTTFVVSMASGASKRPENSEIIFTVTDAEGKDLPADASLTAAYNGATLMGSYTLNGKTVTKAFGQLVVLSDVESIDGVYQIATADDFRWFVEKVNAGETAYNAILLNDLEITGVASINSYAGTFDGNGNVLNINAPLFGSVTTGTVKNVTVTGTINKSNSTMAGIVSTINGAATIENCVNKANITTSSYRGGTIGGIAGNVDNADAKIVKSVNEGTITGGSYYQSNFGGIAAVNNGSIEQCINKGNVSATNTQSKYVGGIAGSNSGSIKDCYNVATIKATANAGGIVGFQSGTAVISDVYNIGTASHGSIIGGVAGGTVLTLTNVYGLEGTCSKLINGEPTITGEAQLLSAADLKAATLGDAWSVHKKVFNNGYPVLKWNVNIGNSTAMVTLTDNVEGTAQYCRGDIVELDVVVSGGKTVNGVEADITYNATALEYLDGATKVNEDGSIHLDEHGVMENDSVVTTLRFKIKEDGPEAGTYNFGFLSAVAQDYNDARSDKQQADITVDSIEVVKSVAGVYVEVKADYVNGYTLIVAAKTDGNAGDDHYSYDGNDMVYIESYDAFVWLIEGATTVKDAASKVTVSTSEDYITVNKNFDVNGTGNVDFSDATVAFGCANVVGSEPYSIVDDLLFYLCADVNGDYKVDASDVATILNR